MNKIRIASAIAGGILALAGAVACGGGHSNKAADLPIVTTTPDATASAAPVVSNLPYPDDDAAPAAETTAPNELAGWTTEQKNALEAALEYAADGSGFSRKGLIHQLAYEGYSTNDATKAVDYLASKARNFWNNQAVASAKSYLDGSSFSKASLLHQLKYEGFTDTQAAYGVSKAYR